MLQPHVCGIYCAPVTHLKCHRHLFRLGALLHTHANTHLCHWSDRLTTCLCEWAGTVWLRQIVSGSRDDWRILWPICKHLTASADWNHIYLSAGLGVNDTRTSLSVSILNGNPQLKYSQTWTAYVMWLINRVNSASACPLSGSFFSIHF